MEPPLVASPGVAVPPPYAAPPPAHFVASWQSIPEVLNHLFQLFLKSEDIWSLAMCSSVCRTWRRLISTLAAQAAPHPIDDEPTFYKDKKWSSSHFQTGFHIIPASVPFRSERAKLYNKTIGAMIGRGSFSRVFNLGAISPWCIKVASGGLAAQDRFVHGDQGAINQVLAHELHLTSLQITFYSSGQTSKMLTHEEIGAVLMHEYNRMIDYVICDLPAGETEPLYPRPFCFGLVERTAFYVMEKLNGVTVRSLLRAAVRGEYNSEVVEIDFAPLIVQLLSYMDHYMRKGYFHGDMKPENIMLVPNQPSGWRLRLIDPVPKPSQDKGIMALPYNPAAFLDFRADFASIILLIREILDGRRPFDRLRGVNNELPYLRRAIGDDREYSNAPDSLFALTKSVIAEKLDLMFLRAYGRQPYKKEFAALAAALEGKRFALRVPPSALTSQSSLQSQRASSTALEAQFPPPPPKESLALPAITLPPGSPTRSAMKKSDGSGSERSRKRVSMAAAEETAAALEEKR